MDWNMLGGCAALNTVVMDYVLLYIRFFWGTREHRYSIMCIIWICCSRVASRCVCAMLRDWWCTKLKSFRHCTLVLDTETAQQFHTILDPYNGKTHTTRGGTSNFGGAAAPEKSVNNNARCETRAENAAATPNSRRSKNEITHWLTHSVLCAAGCCWRALVFRAKGKYHSRESEWNLATRAPSLPWTSPLKGVALRILRRTIGIVLYNCRRFFFLQMLLLTAADSIYNWWMMINKWSNYIFILITQRVFCQLFQY